jgi:tetratricopeptide (TPR) repeat protein
LTDAWTARIRALCENKALGEIDSLWELLFRERLRDEVSAFITRKATSFFSLLLDFYINAAARRKRPAILVVENIHAAEKVARDILFEVFAGLKSVPKNGFVVLGTCDEGIDNKDLHKWKQIFQRVIKFDGTHEALKLPQMPADLWEIAYAISLFGRYYPDSLFQRLFEEEAKNPAMISRALSFLSALGVIDSPQDPRPCLEGFTDQAERVLGERTGPIKALVYSRLLDWVKRRKLSPCFRLLVIIGELGGMARLDDRLILESIVSDIINETPTSIELACESGLLEKIAGSEKAVILRFIFEAILALHLGGEEDIRSAFNDPPPDSAGFPVLKAQILVSLCGYYLGLRDYEIALKTVKEALLLSQEKNNMCLAQSYRLFSLASLSKQQTSETIDYLGFAMASAEKAGSRHELGVSAYYAAAVEFLFGNLSKAVRLARMARDYSLSAGCPGWADRSRFLEGRLAFEIGRYDEALDIFETVQNEPFDRISPEREQVVAAWIYRAKIYFQNPLIPKPETGGHDADLFEIEAAYMAGDYRKCAELSGSPGNPYSEDKFLFTERPDWRNGFAQCELLYFSRGEIWNRMVCVYHSLALCRLSDEGGETALYDMQRLLRDEGLSGMDPWDPFYCYAWYRILEQTGTDRFDMGSAVSMAFKRLQLRAGRIDDAEIRSQYISRPRWNSALTLTAKEFKLI